MLEFPRWKVWLVSLVVAIGVFFSIPSLLAGTPWPANGLPGHRTPRSTSGSTSPAAATCCSRPMRAMPRSSGSSRWRIRSRPSFAAIPRIEIGDISTAGGRLSFMVRDPTQVDAAVERLRTLTRPVAYTGNRDWDVTVVNSTQIVLTPTASGSAQALKDAMGVARDVVRRRIDPSGTKEITVITEGGNRILVEVPGVEDPEALKRLIGQTARLEFKLVDLNANPADVQQGRAHREPGPADGRRRRLYGGHSPGDGVGRTVDHRSRRDSSRTGGRPSTLSSMRRRPAFRASDQGECQQAVRDHSRRQDPVRRPTSTSRSWADALRSAAISQVRARTTLRFRFFGKAAGEPQRDRGTERQRRTGQGYDREEGVIASLVIESS